MLWKHKSTAVVCTQILIIAVYKVGLKGLKGYAVEDTVLLRISGPKNNIDFKYCCDCHIALHKFAGKQITILMQWIDLQVNELDCAALACDDELVFKISKDRKLWLSMSSMNCVSHWVVKSHMWREYKQALALIYGIWKQ